MAHSLLNPEGAMKSLEEGTISAVSSFFPIEGKKQKLVLNNIYAGKDVDHEDTSSQKRAKTRGRTWAVGIYADMDLVDKETGKKVDTVTGMKLINLPKLTRRYSFIVDGTEYQADNQWRLKSGVYSRKRANGELEAQFNLAEGRGFRMDFYPTKRQFLLRYGTANIQLLPVLRALGVKDDDIREAWGNQVFEAVAANRSRGDVQKLAKALDYKFQGDDAAAAKVIAEKYAASTLRADTTALTLGKPYTNVEPETLLRAATKLLNINRDVEEVDNRDSLRFKELWSVEEHIPERILNSGKRAQFKIKNNIDRKENIREIITTDIFNVPVKAYFTSTSLAQMSPQLNPVEMAAGFLRTTLMGQGAISSDQAISLDAKMIDSSMLGIVDPVHTPEGNAGVSTHLTLGTGKRGKEPVIKVYDVKRKTLVEKTPAEIAQGSIAFPDQYETGENGVPTPLTKVVTVIPKGGGDPTQVRPDEVDFIMRSPKSMFSITANLVPFLPADQANRAGMATRHIEQAISLKEREAPLVQVGADSSNPRIDTWEKILGKTAAHVAPVDGKVISITEDKIVILGEDKKKYEVGIYDNYPLNEKKAFIHSTPLVKVGDTVKKDDIIGDTNYTKGGTLALGRNLKVAYLDWNGANFEDAIVVSEKAAKELTSLHQHKPRVFLDKGMQVGLAKFRANFPSVITADNAKKLDENGIVKKGETVMPGDVIMTVLKKNEPSPEQVMLKGIHKALARPYKNVSVVWDHDYPGTVTDVAVNGNELVTYITTEEPLDVADKLCFAPDHEILTKTGWKPVAEVVPGDLVASLSPTGEIEYLHPAAVTSYSGTHRMYSLETTQVSMLVTEEHKLFAALRPRHNKQYDLLPAREMAGKNYRLSMVGDWRGGVPLVDFKLPDVQVAAGQGGVATRTIIGKLLPASLFLPLLAAYLSDGNQLYIPSSGSYGIEITKPREPNRTKLLSLLTEHDIHYTTCANGKIRIHSKNLWEYFKQFGHAHEKYVPEWVFELPKDQQELFLQWCLWGDGHVGKTGITFTTVSPALANAVQRISFHTGRAARIAITAPTTAFLFGKVCECRERFDVFIYQSKFYPEINHGHAKQQGGQLEQWVTYVGDVFCVTLPYNHVLYTRRNGKCHWSGNSNRHGGKGVVGTVVPTEEMPKNAAGEPIDIMVSPMGVPGRINLGQVLETLLGKVAHQNGTTFAVDNFQTDGTKKIAYVDGHYRSVKTDEGVKKVWVKPHMRTLGYQEVVKEVLKANKVDDTEELFDPQTGKSFGKVLTGYQYFIKLTHQVDKKIAARSHGYGNDYDANLAPKGGGDGGAQRYGELGMYAMLAHGATSELRDAYTYKSDKAQQDVWTAIQTGEPLPTPKTSFAYEKFLAYLKAAGLTVEKDGNELRLLPFTDSEIKKLSNGALTDASKVLRGKDLRPEPGGLFDEKITGGPGGKNFAHIPLAITMPNPLFERAIMALLGVTGKQYDQVIAGEVAMDGKTGPEAIISSLAKIDVDAELKEAKQDLKTARRSNLDAAYKRVKYLQAIKNLGTTADKAYGISNIPVIPPVFRPITAMEGGDLNVDGVNLLYRDVAMLNDQYNASKKVLPDSAMAPVRKDLYEAVSSLIGIDAHQTGLSSNGEAKPPGILSILSGRNSPKESYVHTKLMDRRQDLTGRSVITPDQTLGIDQLGLPKDIAYEVYRPFAVAELTKIGYTPLTAREELAKRTSLAERALEIAVSKRPVIFKRDPVLHKFGIMAYYPKLHDGKDIKIHPLATGGHGADFDGDSVGMESLLILRIEGKVCQLTGHELCSYLAVPSEGNQVVYVQNIETYTYSGWAPVTVVSAHTVLDKKKYEVTLHNGYSVVVSEDHSLMSGGEQVKPREVGVGTRLDSCTPTHSAGAGSYDEGVIYGHFLGDGCAGLRSTGGGRLSMACKPATEKAYLMGLWQEFAVGSKVTSFKHGFQVSNVALAGEFLATCGKYAKGKFVGYELLNRGRDFLSGLLSGYILADGSVERTASGSYLVRTWSLSKELRDGMALVATLLGLPHAVRTRKKGAATHYILSFGKEAILQLDYRCPGEKSDRLLEAKHAYRTNRRDSRASQSANGYCVKSIKEVDYTDRMLDLSVDGQEHVFSLAGGLLVHNTMAVFVPVSAAAVEDAKRMLPSNNLYNFGSGRVEYQPTLGAQLGLYLSTQFGEETNKTYPSMKEALDAYGRGEILASNIIKVDGKKTTAGRIAIYAALPEQVRSDDVLTDPKLALEKNNLQKLMKKVATIAPKEFGPTMDKLKNIGFNHQHNTGFSFSASDFDTLSAMRDEILKGADKKALLVHTSTLSREEKDKRLVDIYTEATNDMAARAKPLLEASGSKLYAMNKAGTKPAWAQVQQMILAPMLLANATGRVIPTPVTKSYAEGLDTAGYWTASSGARKGLINKVESVQKPGVLSKQLINATIQYSVTENDCGTTKGIALDIDEPDVIGRVLPKDISVAGTTYKAGTVLTTNVVDKLKQGKVSRIAVRSVLKCQSKQGLCQKCFGELADGAFPEIGTNLGVLAGQSIGERGTQLAMKEFHLGGLAGTQSKTSSAVDRVFQLLKMPETLPDAATLSTVSGKVQSVSKSPLGGYEIKVNGEAHYLPGSREPIVRTGDEVEKGDKLSDGLVNPRTLMDLTGVEQVQRYMTDELHGAYKSEGIKRRNTEVVIKAMTNLSKVVDPGDSDEFIRGDNVSTTYAEALNREKGYANPIVLEPMLRGLETQPLDRSTDWMARLQYRKLKDTYVRGVSEGWKTDIHGMSPIPGLVYSAEFGKPAAGSKSPY